MPQPSVTEQAVFVTTHPRRRRLGGILNDLVGARYVNHPAAVTRAEFKPAQLQAAGRLGFDIPPTLVTNDVEQARTFAAEHKPIIYKSFRGAPPTAVGHVARDRQRVWLGDPDGPSWDLPA